MPPEASPGQAAAAWHLARLRADQSAQQLQSERARLLGSAGTAIEALDVLGRAVGAWSTENAATAADIRGHLERARTSPAHARGEDVTAVFEAVERFEDFRERLLGRESHARLEHAQLSARLRTLSEERFAGYFPPMARRASGLLEAMPWASRDWIQMLEQLKEVRQILDRIEAEGRRRSALDLERAFAAMSREVAVSPGSARARSFAAALRDLEPFVDKGMLPPYALRARVLRLAEGRTEVTGA
jgi:hypothetical protein